MLLHCPKHQTRSVNFPLTKGYIMKVVFTIIITLLAFSSHAQRVKDLADVAGVRSNQLIGYGLVVGLPGTGEQSPFTEQSFKTMLSNFGITMPENLKPKIKNVAAVAVHADLNAFAKPGQTIDVTVSSMGSAQSLRGGTLVQTILMGIDGNAYAVAQGSLVVSGLGAEGLDGSKVLVNTPTVGRISNGAIVEREVKSPFSSGDHITFNLRQSDFTTAKRLSDTINDLIAGSARAIDATSVEVRAPRDIADRVSFLSVLENLRVSLELDLDIFREHNLRSANVFESMGGYSPTIGILGAVLGLIHAMSNLTEPSLLGQGIATAFIATIYGVGFANLIYLPIANKIRAIIHQQTLYREMISEGLTSLAQGENPRAIENKLSAFRLAR